MPFFAERGLGLFKIEVTPGVDPVPTPAANAVLIRNIAIRPEPNIIAREFLRTNLSMLKDVVARSVMNVSFDFAIKGAGGAVDAVPRWGPIIRSFQFGQTINAASNVTYAFVDSAHESCTGYIYMDGILHKLTFMSGVTLRSSQRVSQFPVWTVEMRALYVAPEDAAIPGGAVFDPSIEVPCQGQTWTLGGYAAIASALEISLATNLGIREDLHAADGLIGFQHGRRNVTGSIDPEAVTEATHPFWANFRAGTSVALAANTIGSAVGNRVAINAPAVQYDGPTWGTRERTRTYQVGLRLRASADNTSDEMSIVTT